MNSNIKPNAMFKVSGILFFIFLLVTLLIHLEPTESWDRMVGERLYRIGERDGFFIFLSYIGSKLFFYPALVVMTLFILWKRNWYLALFLWVNLVGVRMLNTFLKTIFSRDRPSLDHVVEAGFYSFPSGHSMNSMAFFGAIAFLCYWMIKKNWIRNTLMTVCFVLIGLIGFSRVYLGVHYPLDVLGGFAMGASWLLFLGGIYLKVVHNKKTVMKTSVTRKKDERSPHRCDEDLCDEEKDGEKSSSPL
ncbi:phosphatase PAP2 family protein [Sutcliffiella horikoshii]|uniref:Phosphatase PAP2 family protein n=1 Tax=Sutcliffiella horikoshii TaxID=79883 RepID=A0A5D4SJN1_9BACI|nr:phosphatase PAP2 family protein [Sutcliffiella horikoshii]TYS63655.1 phosphatase PAP2 family protein [Sutcliffiella horikoshii]